MTTTANWPLEGVRVLELCHHLAGPACTLVLADMGADVVKVEPPRGDDSRRSVPPEIHGESAAFMAVNRNKRGIVLDLKQPAAKEVLLRLADTADILVENYKKGVMERLGLGYEALRKRNPRLVYCAISGFGRTGPYSDRAGFDLIAQGMTGLMSVTGEGAGRPPVKVGVPITDTTAGFLAAIGVLAAYSRRLKTGEGQMVDTSLFEAGIAHTFWASAVHFAENQPPRAMGSAHPLNAPYQAFATADGWINVGGPTQQSWLALLDVLDARALDADARFSSNKARMMNLPALQEKLGPLFRTRTSADWLAQLSAAGVAAGPINDIGEMLADPQTAARGLVVELDHQHAGRVKALGPLIKFSDSTLTVRRPAPALGQHTREVLAQAGYSHAEIDCMAAQGAIHCDS